ncbi:MAG: hypothetical protein ABIF89_02850, partial [bacterium]
MKNDHRKKLKELKRGIIEDINWLSHQEQLHPESKIAVFKDFVLSQAKRYGIIVREGKLSVIEGNKGMYSIVKVALRFGNVYEKLRALALMPFFIFQILPPFAIRRFSEEGQFIEIVYKPAGIAALPTFYISVLFYGFISQGLKLDMFITSSVIILVFKLCEIFSKYLINSEGHELTHVYQTLILERIRVESGITIRQKAFQEIITSAVRERQVRNLHYVPPSRRQLKRMVNQLFRELHKRGAFPISMFQNKSSSSPLVKIESVPVMPLGFKPYQNRMMCVDGACCFIGNPLSELPKGYVTNLELFISFPDREQRYFVSACKDLGILFDYKMNRLILSAACCIYEQRKPRCIRYPYLNRGNDWACRYNDLLDGRRNLVYLLYRKALNNDEFMEAGEGFRAPGVYFTKQAHGFLKRAFGRNEHGFINLALKKDERIRFIRINSPAQTEDNSTASPLSLAKKYFDALVYAGLGFEKPQWFIWGNSVVLESRHSTDYMLARYFEEDGRLLFQFYDNEEHRINFHIVNNMSVHFSIDHDPEGYFSGVGSINGDINSRDFENFEIIKQDSGIIFKLKFKALPGDLKKFILTHGAIFNSQEGHKFIIETDNSHFVEAENTPFVRWSAKDRFKKRYGSSYPEVLSFIGLSESDLELIKYPKSFLTRPLTLYDFSGTKVAYEHRLLLGINNSRELVYFEKKNR